MGTGILAVCLCMALGQNNGDMRYANFRSLRVPVDVPVALQPEIRELLLFASTNQGRAWKQVAGPISPDKKEFAFYAPADGVYWLRVVKITRQGKQEPDDMALMSGPADMKLQIDTIRPIVKTITAQRHGDDVYVNWDVQEDNPDLSKDGMLLEFQVKDAPAPTWKAIPIAANLKGQAQFNPGTKQALVIRLTMRDLAKNESYGMAELAGTVTPVGFNNGGGAVGVQQSGGMPPVLADLPKPAIDEKRPIAPLTKSDVMPKPSFPDAGAVLPPAPGGLIGPPPGGLVGPPPGGLIGPPPAVKEPGDKVIADSRFPPPPVEPPKVVPPAHEGPGGIAPSKETPFEGKSIANAAPARKPLPPIQYVNQHQVMLEYELRRVGPSGIGSIELWLTRDDGATWERYAIDKDPPTGSLNNRQKRTFDLRDGEDRPLPDGIYGLALVVKNRAGAGKTPRPGDAPEIRIEIDTLLPAAQLFQPIADPQHPENVLLKWTAEDKNLTQTPINLEYAEKAEGPWLPIATDVENTGRFSWKMGPAVPVQVYLRMRVRDKAGNERILATPQAQFVDFTEPEGALIGVQAGKAP